MDKQETRTKARQSGKKKQGTRTNASQRNCLAWSMSDWRFALAANAFGPPGRLSSIEQRQLLHVSIPPTEHSCHGGLRPRRAAAGRRFIKLNTNENPYPPSPRVFEAIRELDTGGHLRKYPDPLGTAFRRSAAGCSESIRRHSHRQRVRRHSDDPYARLRPRGRSGSLARRRATSLRTSPELQAELCPTRVTGNCLPWPIPQADLTLLANPNSPSGTSAEP